MFGIKLDRFFSAIKPVPTIKLKVEKLTKSLVSRYSNGNVSIQNGNYLTQTDIKNKEQTIFAHKFI